MDEHHDEDYTRLQFLLALMIWKAAGRKFNKPIRISQDDIAPLEGTVRVVVNRHWSGDLLLGVAPIHQHEEDKHAR